MDWLTPSLFLQAFATWLGPFVCSFAFFDEQGDMRVHPDVFKVCMAVGHAVAGARVLRRTINKLKADRPLLGRALATGAVLLIVNWICDIAILIPVVNHLNKDREDREPFTIASWFCQIGVGYFVLMVQAWLAGSVADAAVGRAPGAKKEAAAKAQ